MFSFRLKTKLQLISFSRQFFEENPDDQNPALKIKLGIYTENCGLDKVTMSWGHDEYMYLVIVTSSDLTSALTSFLSYRGLLFSSQWNDIGTFINWQVAKGNNTTLPPAGLFIIRFHSFYGEPCNSRISHQRTIRIGANVNCWDDFYWNFLVLWFGQPYTDLDLILTWWMMRTRRCWSGSKCSSTYDFLFPFVHIYKKMTALTCNSKLINLETHSIQNKNRGDHPLICFLCSKYDLYSKSKVRINVEEVKPYYLSLIQKVYIHHNLRSHITDFKYFNHIN